MKDYHKSVNIVAIKDGWILEKIARHLDDRLPYVVFTEKPNKKSKVTYFINYAQATDSRVSEIEIAYFTHIEESVGALVDKWWKVAADIDIAVSQSKLYANKIIKKSRTPSIVIPPGVDLDKFKPSPVKIGVVGKTKYTGRKGEDLIKKVMDIPGIEWRFTGAGWPGESQYYKEEEIPGFYAQLDYVLIASKIEGGPMCAIEALASGVPIISTDVGWVPELPHIKFNYNDEKQLRRILTNIVSKKAKLRASVEKRTWDNFVNSHDYIFKCLLELEPKPSKRAIKSILKSAPKY
jgi:glycosyltransferase involved in cell wall biosynthesis